jgi:hypothetical protein
MAGGTAVSAELARRRDAKPLLNMLPVLGGIAFTSGWLLALQAAQTALNLVLK